MKPREAIFLLDAYNAAVLAFRAYLRDYNEDRHIPGSVCLTVAADRYATECWKDAGLPPIDTLLIAEGRA